MKKAILLISFGTSHADTREKTLDVILEDMKKAFPDHRVYIAWTSKVILRVLARRDGVIIPSIAQAMEQINQDGVEELVVQPSHIINGIETDTMKEEVLSNRGAIAEIRFGHPLLTSTQDLRDALKAAMEETKAASDTAVVWMGHGTHHYANHVYMALVYLMREMGYTNGFMGTVESDPNLEDVIAQVKAAGFRKVKLQPFMMVAGDHAKNDMSGEEEDSWKSRFQAEGCEVQCVLKGLGENPAIRSILVEHARRVLEKEHPED